MGASLFVSLFPHAFTSATPSFLAVHPDPALPIVWGFVGWPFDLRGFSFILGAIYFLVPGLHAGRVREPSRPSPVSPHPVLSGLTLSNDFVSLLFLGVSVWELGPSSLVVALTHLCPLHLCQVRASLPPAPAHPVVLRWFCGSLNSRPMPLLLFSRFLRFCGWTLSDIREKSIESASLKVQFLQI